MAQTSSSLWSRLRTRLLGPSKPSCHHDPKAPGNSQNITTLKPIILSSGDIASLPIESFPSSDKGNVSWQTLLSAPSTKSDTFTVGIAVCKPETGRLAMHRHLQAEIYYITSGTGTVEIGGKQFAVKEGDVVFIPGDMEHGVSNTGAQELKWLYFFAANGFQDVVYKFVNDDMKDE